MGGEGKKNFRLTLEYDGSGYHGWQRQPHDLTLQEVLEDALALMLQAKVTVAAAGRTDAGVHALGQVVSFKAVTRLGPEELKAGLNSLLPPDISVAGAEETDGSFHARFTAKSKEYAYRIINRAWPAALERNRAWWVKRPLDVPAMRDGLAPLVGEHDFTSFCATGSGAKSKVRNLMRAEIGEGEGGLIVFTFEADGFLRKMIRNMVGTLVEVGLKKMEPGRVKDILEGRDRRLAGPTAPARGLYLLRVNY